MQANRGPGWGTRLTCVNHGRGFHGQKPKNPLSINSREALRRLCANRDAFLARCPFFRSYLPMDFRVRSTHD